MARFYRSATEHITSSVSYGLFYDTMMLAFRTNLHFQLCQQMLHDIAFGQLSVYLQDNNFRTPPSQGVEYCVECIDLSVCPFVREHISGKV